MSRLDHVATAEGIADQLCNLPQDDALAVALYTLAIVADRQSLPLDRLATGLTMAGEVLRREKRA